MTAMNFKLMNSLRFKTSFNWSVYYANSTDIEFSDKYNFVKIGDVLTRSKELANIKDGIIYKRVRIKLYGKGVRIRDEVLGKEIKTKHQFILKSGQFLFSRIDARNGAFGIATEEVNSALITNDFPAYDVDSSKINSAFLSLITGSKHFFNFCQSLSNGTTGRQRLDESNFLSFRIPLPNLSTQNQLVERYNENLAKAQNAQLQADELEKGIEKYLFEALGIEVPEKKETKLGLQMIRFNVVSKWGVDSLKELPIIKYQYPQCKIGEICKIGSGATPKRIFKNYYENGVIPWIKTGELNNEIINSAEEKITIEGLKDSNAKLYEAGSLIVAMYGATAGRTGKLSIQAATNQACAVLFDINNDQILTDYLWLYLQNQIDFIKGLAQGSAQPNLNASMISDYIIQIPPLDKQREWIKFFFNDKSQVKNLRKQSDRLKQQAKEDFEKEIFA